MFDQNQRHQGSIPVEGYNSSAHQDPLLQYASYYRIRQPTVWLESRGFSKGMVDSSLDGLMVRCSPRMHILDEIGFDSVLRYRIFPSEPTVT